MATSRKKPSTLARVAQDKRRKPSRPKAKAAGKGRKSPGFKRQISRPKPKRSTGKGTKRSKSTTRAKAEKRPKAAKRRPVKALKPSKVSKASKRRPPTKRAKAPTRAPAKAKKPSKRPKAPKVPKRSAQTRVRAQFEKAIVRAKKARTLVEPRYRRRRGKSDLRGTVGAQRDLPIEAYWEELEAGQLEYDVESTYRDLERHFYSTYKAPGSPTFYARFTFITHGSFPLHGGSKKAIFLKTGQASKLGYWFYKTPSGLSVETAMHHFVSTLDEIADELESAGAEAMDAGAFLSHISLYAYALDPNR